MAKPVYVVKPIARSKARKMCEHHPHAGTLPNSTKYCMELLIDGKSAGLAAWGYGIVPKVTPRKLFGDAGRVEDYLELCRFFVYDWCPKNSASKFLAITHRLIKKYAPKIRYLYTYAAGFQGLIGHIYKAAGYDYIGRQLCDAFLYVKDKGLIHSIAIWHRWNISWNHGKPAKDLERIFPGAPVWKGYNFCYLYWLCDEKEKARLLDHAKFEIQPYPTEADMEIWLAYSDGRTESITPEFARSIPIVKLKSKRSRASEA